MEIFITEVITNETVNRVLQEIIVKKQEDQSSDVVVYINSPGGDVEAGYAIYEILKSSCRKVITYAVNEVFSCAVVIYLAGDERYATNYSHFMIHEPYHEYAENDGNMMTTSSYERNLKELQTATNEYFNLICKNTLLTAAKIKNSILKTKSGDWYFRSSEAKKYGIVTKVGVPLF